MNASFGWLSNTTFRLSLTFAVFDIRLSQGKPVQSKQFRLSERHSGTDLESILLLSCLEERLSKAANPFVERC